MGVMCLVLAVLTWANALGRVPTGVGVYRGFPLTYTTDGCDMVKTYPDKLALNLTVALTVSITLALASERFVFRKLRRGPRPETQEDLK
jgi:hypothetical protein